MCIPILQMHYFLDSDSWYVVPVEETVCENGSNEQEGRCER